MQRHHLLATIAPRHFTDKSLMSLAATLTCQNLSWSINQQPILQKMTWSLAAGERLGIIGPNGAGKSTLLKLLAGLLTPTTGEVQINQQSLQKLSAKQRAQQIGFLNQEIDPASTDTVWQLVALGRLPHQRWYQSFADVDCGLISAALAHTDLSGRALSKLAELSGGELQRAHLARVLVQQTGVLLLDEPTNHLDVQHQHQLLALTCQSALKRELTLVASFHDLNLAASYCDKLLLLERGQVIALATPAEVLTSQQLERVYQRRCLVDSNPFDGAPRVTFAPEHS
jgi:iron complex transport system ATP-binding protein